MGFATERPYAPENVTEGDMQFASILFGWVLGFACWCIVTAWHQTHKLSIYVVLIWLEIATCVIFATICWCYISGRIDHSFAFFFAILTCWALQVQLLLQIIVNRVNLLIGDRKQQMWLKWGTAGLITTINVSVYCIWIPARLQINENYIRINEWWDRCEKVIYLVVDLLLNLLFIRTVAVHPVAYLTKLAIEMSMADLIIQISSAKPQRAPLAQAFNGLKIAVSTHTTTTAVQIEGEDASGPPAFTTTRTPARPDLPQRLANMRRERAERKAAAAAQNLDHIELPTHVPKRERQGSEDSLDIDEEKLEMETWRDRECAAFGG
ncbi:hypothetical protein JCM10908_002107 [Rhodotorula pacifica]|uniref:uncharacterized protein n=1 Tax=Rhodotorula pacifica TaxID=1495444 RepID=UPI003178F565